MHDGPTRSYPLNHELNQDANHREAAEQYIKDVCPGRPWDHITAELEPGVRIHVCKE